jgi:Fe/S biogenesis protein NfuA
MIEITPDARERIQELVQSGIVQDPALRITLAAGAQSPLSRGYDISLVDREDRQKTEIAINVDGIRVFLNLDTSNLLSGAVVRWVEDEGGFRVEDPKTRPAPPRPAPDLPISGPLVGRVQNVIDTVINPGIAAHGGFVELVDVSDETLYLRMGGGCQGCAASAATLRQGIERMVRQEVPEILNIVDVTDHEAGVNPYY